MSGFVVEDRKIPTRFRSYDRITSPLRNNMRLSSQSRRNQGALSPRQRETSHWHVSDRMEDAFTQNIRFPIPVSRSEGRTRRLKSKRVIARVGDCLSSKCYVTCAGINAKAFQWHRSCVLRTLEDGSFILLERRSVRVAIALNGDIGYRLFSLCFQLSLSWPSSLREKCEEKGEKEREKEGGERGWKKRTKESRRIVLSRGAPPSRYVRRRKKKKNTGRDKNVRGEWARLIFFAV